MKARRCGQTDNEPVLTLFSDHAYIPNTLRGSERFRKDATKRTLAPGCEGLW